MRRSVLLAIALLLSCGCGPLVLDFGTESWPSLGSLERTAPALPWPDDEPPTLRVTNIDPDEPTLAGDIAITYLITDPDSHSYRVSAWLLGEDGPRALTLVNPTTAPNVVERSFPEAPVYDERTIVWASAADVPTLELGVRLKLCPVGPDGRPGECDIFPAEGTLDIFQPGAGALCAPGDLEALHWLDGYSPVPLSNDECPNVVANDPPLVDDFSAQFLLVLTNPEPEEVGFRITVSEPSRSAPPRPPPPPVRPAPITAPPGRARTTCEDDLDVSDVHQDTQTFFFREHLGPDAPRGTRGATLRALGDNLAVYVDDETPIEIDTDCGDPDNAIDPGELPAFGFNNCDLLPLVEVFDKNIHPTLEAKWGGLPDVDQNCRTTIFLSHRLNRLTLSDDDPTNDDRIVRAFAEPEFDLWQSNLVFNPDGNEQEIIFVYAPDPVGFYGRFVPLDDYLSVDLFAAVARAYAGLLSYGAHGGFGNGLGNWNNPGPPPQEPWLQQGLAFLGADLTGFGAAAHEEVWAFLDASHLQSLEAPRGPAEFGTHGGPYLFARALWEQYGDAIFTDLAASSLRGMDAIDELTGAPDAFLLQWATAIAVSGRLNEEGGRLVPDDVILNMAAPTQVVVADPEAPQEGELAGANGYQQGVELHGVNRTWTGGDAVGGPREIEARRVLTRGVDPLLLHPGADFFGTIAPDGGVAVILVGGLTDPQNRLTIRTSGPSLLGNVVRIEDASPHRPHITLEDAEGADTTVVEVRLAPGVAGRVVGRIEAPTAIASSTHGSPEIVLADTDRYAFFLDVPARVGIELNRRYVDLVGSVPLLDPFFAVALADDVPDALDYAMWGFGPATGPCAEPAAYDYPTVMPDWIAAQGNLSVDPLDLGGFATRASVPGGDLTLPCALDHDQDGIADSDEPRPATLIHQIQQRQAENLALDANWYLGGFDTLPVPLDVSAPFFDATFVDVDSNEWPDDEEATAFHPLGIGGRSTVYGEDAVWTGLLPAGSYVIVVGDAAGSVGPYDLEVRILDPE
jgi:hypothetical protein